MQFRHPCKYCIVKPICNSPCILLEEFIDIFELLTVGLTTLFSLIATIILVALASIYISKDVAFWGIFIFYIITYILLIYTYLHESKEFNNFGLGGKLFVIILYPYLLTTLIIIGIINSLFNIRKYIYRYHPSINTDQAKRN